MAHRWFGQRQTWPHATRQPAAISGQKSFDKNQAGHKEKSRASSSLPADWRLRTCGLCGGACTPPGSTGRARQKLLRDGKRHPGNSLSMRKFDFVAKRKRIFHPNCAQCGVPMWLSHIDDGTPEHQRTFECPRCERVAIRIVKDC